MGQYTQANRLLSVATPLGADVLLLASFAGQEEMSRLFSYQLEMLSEQDAVAPKDIVGKQVAWTVQPVGGTPRVFNGVVSRFAAGPRKGQNLRSYRAEVVPWLWFLTLTSDCRIFQNKTAKEVVQQIFKDLGFTQYEYSLRAEPPKLEYCVQYRETDFQFVSRLLEENGVFYYFRHEKDKHTLVLADQKSAYKDCAEKDVDYSAGSLAPHHVGSWEHQYAFRAGKWAQTDYNFETPQTNLMTNAATVVKLPGNDKYERYDYPGRYLKKPDGDAETNVRMEEEETGYEVVAGAGTCSSFTPGGRFTLKSHESPSERGKAWVVASIRHSARDESHLAGSGAAQGYENSFTCIPDSVVYRPARVTPKPVVQGPQTAVVVGPSGEEIYVDKYGRIKVQFFWDREGKQDENSSCWIRVAETPAGKNWGAVFTPRVGQEVIVAFLEGDPDRPIVLGGVYNADQMPPYELPGNKTRTVLKTRSSKGGGEKNFSELRFEDKKDSEDIYFHAEKDFHRVVENDDDLKVGRDQTIEVKNNRTETVKEGDEKVTVSKGKRTIVVETGDDSHQVKKGNREAVIDLGNDSITIKMGNQTTKLNLGKSETEAMQSIELKVGQSSVKIDQTGVTIKGMMISIEGQIQTELKGVMTQVNGSGMLQVAGGIIMIG